jgi:hypothetical protein
MLLATTTPHLHQQELAHDLQDPNRQRSHMENSIPTNFSRFHGRALQHQQQHLQQQQPQHQPQMAFPGVSGDIFEPRTIEQMLFDNSGAGTSVTVATTASSSSATNVAQTPRWAHQQQEQNPQQ